MVPRTRMDLDFYSPTVNLARDPRWGRNDETFSEDPLLTADLAAQFVNGMEGKDRPAAAARRRGFLKTMTTIKHFAANNSEVNRRTARRTWTTAPCASTTPPSSGASSEPTPARS